MLTYSKNNSILCTSKNRSISAPPVACRYIMELQAEVERAECGLLLPLVLKVYTVPRLRLLEPMELLPHLLLESSCFRLRLLLFWLRVLSVGILCSMLRVRVFDDWLRLPLGLEDLLRLQLLTLLRHALQLLQVLVVVCLDCFEEYIGLS